MFLIIGLGNPGKKYEETRHNIGFKAIDEIVANFQFSLVLLQKGEVQSPKENLRLPTGQTIFNAQISKGEIADKKVVLAKPQTFMNLSGKAVRKIMSNVKCQMSNVSVVHDDIDLPLGKIKISFGRGSAGHKGVESIIRELKTKDFVRFRIGIQPVSGKPKNAEGFVLKKFSREEEKIVQEVIKKTCKAIEFYLAEGLEKSMSKYNNQQTEFETSIQ